MLREEQINKIARDCVHFKGNRPCQMHLRQGALCRCQAYSPRGDKILIIQLSSAVTVIRSSALVHRLKADNPNVHITYLTCFPELLTSAVDEPLGLDGGSVLRIQTDRFDAVYNLDMDRRACALMNVIDAEVKKGFYLRGGQPLPLDGAAQVVYLRELLPRTCGVTKINNVQLLFQLCGFEYRREQPRLETPKGRLSPSQDEGTLVGLATGIDVQSGISEPWSREHWIHLVEMLSELGLSSVLLGNHPMGIVDKQIAQNTTAQYPGQLTLSGLVSQVSHCDVIVTTPGMTAELAWALGKEVILLKDRYSQSIEQNYFRGRCSTIEPPAVAENNGILNDIQPDQILEAIEEHLKRRNTLPLSQISNKGIAITPTGNMGFSLIRDTISRNRRSPD